MSIQQLQFLLQKNQSVSLSQATIQTTGLLLTNNFDQLIKNYLKLNNDLILTNIKIISDQSLISKIIINANISCPNLGQQFNKLLATIEFKIIDNKLNIIIILPINNSSVKAIPFLKPGIFGYLYDQHSLVNSCFVFASSPITYLWQNQSIQLVEGLNYAAELNLQPFSSIGQFLKIINDQKIIISGIIDPTHIDDKEVIYPDVSLVANLPFDLTTSFTELPNIKQLGSQIFINPRIIINIVRDKALLHYTLVQLAFSVNVGNNIQLDFSTDLSLGSQSAEAISLSMSPSQDKPLTPDNIIKLLAGDNYQESVPSLLKDSFISDTLKTIGLKNFSMTCLTKPQLSVASLSIAIGAVKPWDITEKFTVKDLTLIYTVLNPFAKQSRIQLIKFLASLEFYPEIFQGLFNIEINTDLGDELYIKGMYDGKVSLKDLVKGISNNQVTIPSEIPEVIFHDFGLEFYQNSNKNWDYQLWGNAYLMFDITILEKKLKTDLAAQISRINKQVFYLLKGGVEIGNSYFLITIDLKEQQKIITGLYQHNSQTKLAPQNLINNLSDNKMLIISDFDFNLDQAEFHYDFTNKLMSLTAESSSYGKARLLIFQDQQKRNQYQFELKLNTSAIAIASGLPLVGKTLADQLINLKDLGLIIASADAKDSLVDLPISAGFENQFKKGFTVNGNLVIANQLVPFELKLTNNKPVKNNLIANDNLITNEPEVSQLTSDEGSYLTIQKSLGPINISRIGINYKNEKLWLLIDANLTSSVVNIELIGLGAGLAIKNIKDIQFKDIDFTLSALGIELTTSVVSISGSLLRKIDKDLEEYSGILAIKLGTFSLTAIGSYLSWQAGAKIDEVLYSTSGSAMNAFCIIDYPLGGPPCFFITGLAFGFGYNHDLILPSIDNVSNYPLIKAAYSPNKYLNTDQQAEHGSPLALIKEIKPYMPVKESQYWVAAGVKFTSFELINGFLLATVTFGIRTEIGLLGIASLAIKQDDNIIAQAELVIKAMISPEEGIASLEAQLTANSYVLSKDCRLTGGFAFYTWYGNNEQAGDFVITLGGYHPRFNKPAHYPLVPRLGVNLVVGNFSLKGGLYFALTPICIMIGGSVEAVYETTIVKAWFNLYFDLLVFWKPYSYDIALGISIGVSVNLWFISLTIHLGADLRIWGPEFTGQARIKLWIISFTVEFGAGANQETKAINWDEFQSSFFPTKAEQQLTNSSNYLITDNKYAVCNINLSAGVLREIDHENQKLFIVDPESFEFLVSSLIPIYEPTINQKNSLKTNDVNWRRDFGVGMVRANSISSSSLNISLIGQNEEFESAIDNFSQTPILTKVAKSLWSNIDSKEKLYNIITSKDKEDNVIDNALTSIKFKVVLTPANPNHTQEFELDELLFQRNYMLNYISYTQVSIKTQLTKENNFKVLTLTEISQNINQTQINPNSSLRVNLINYLVKHSQLEQSINQIKLDHFIKRIDNYFTLPPEQSYLGAETVINIAN